MTDKDFKCLKCGSLFEEENRYCSFCGSDLTFQKKIFSKKIRVSLRWIIFTVISLFIFEYIFATIAGQLFVIFSGEAAIELQTSIIISSIGSLAGIYAGSLYSAYMAPGYSIKESIIGAAIEITISQFILFLMSGAFSYLILVRIIIIMIIAFAGAKTGDMLQRKRLWGK